MSATTHRTPGETFAGYSELIAIECGVCGILFAMPAVLDRKAEEDHSRWFYCPNGHHIHYLGKTELRKAEERAEREANRAARAAAQRDQAQASERAQRAAATRARNERNKARKRSADGVCPCCHRSFRQLRTHVAKMHPDYDPAA